MGERERGPLGNTPRSAATMATEDSGLFRLPLMHVIASVLVNFLSIRAKLPRAAQISRGNPWCECNFLPRATVGGAQSARWRGNPFTVALAKERENRKDGRGTWLGNAEPCGVFGDITLQVASRCSWISHRAAA